MRHPLTIGVDGKNAHKYAGYIAEVRVFNTLLNEDTIDAWKCKVLDNSHPNYDNLKGHWKLTKSTGTNIADASPVAADGTLSGGTWKDAMVDEIITMSTYDNTPRTVDVAVSALNHLCIPIQTNWYFDGNSLIEADCSN
jgi:hypothetical protein